MISGLFLRPAAPTHRTVSVPHYVEMSAQVMSSWKASNYPALHPIK